MTLQIVNMGTSVPKTQPQGRFTGADLKPRVHTHGIVMVRGEANAACGYMQPQDKLTSRMALGASQNPCPDCMVEMGIPPVEPQPANYNSPATSELLPASNHRTKPTANEQGTVITKKPPVFKTAPAAPLPAHYQTCYFCKSTLNTEEMRRVKNPKSAFNGQWVCKLKEGCDERAAMNGITKGSQMLSQEMKPSPVAAIPANTVAVNGIRITRPTAKEQANHNVRIAAGLVLSRTNNSLERVTDGSEDTPLPNDGYADGGEPYTEEELALERVTDEDELDAAFDEVETLPDAIIEPVNEYPLPCPGCEQKDPASFMRRNQGTITESVICRKCGMNIHPDYFLPPYPVMVSRDILVARKIITQKGRGNPHPFIRTKDEIAREDLLRVFNQQGPAFIMRTLALELNNPQAPNSNKMRELCGELMSLLLAPNPGDISWVAAYRDAFGVLVDWYTEGIK